MSDPIFHNTSLDYETIRGWFNDVAADGYIHLEVPAEHASKLGDRLGLSIRRCYLTDETLEQLLAIGERTQKDIITACLPNPGSTMSGDFGEVLSYIFHLCDKPSLDLCGPKKWRLKQDRTKPSPKSDVIHFALPNWPSPSEGDQVFCSEVKAKATNGTSLPISSALADSRKDRTSRLASTLVWLRERILLGSETDVTLAQLKRFIDVVDYPTFSQKFYAIAVICGDLIDDELQNDPPMLDPDHQIIILVVPSLKSVYTDVFKKASKAFDTDEVNS